MPRLPRSGSGLKYATLKRDRKQINIMWCRTRGRTPSSITSGLVPLARGLLSAGPRAHDRTNRASHNEMRDRQADSEDRPLHVRPMRLSQTFDLGRTSSGASCWLPAASRKAHSAQRCRQSTSPSLLLRAREMLASRTTRHISSDASGAAEAAAAMSTVSTTAKVFNGGLDPMAS